MFAKTAITKGYPTLRSSHMRNIENLTLKMGKGKVRK